MALLKSVNTNTGVDFHDHRDQLYFKKFKYKLTLRIEGNAAHSPRKYKPGTPINRIDRLREWYAPRKAKGLAVCRKEGRKTSVFSNDLPDLMSIAHLSASPIPAVCSEAIVHPIPGIKLFAREPKHKFRIYFRDIRMPIEVQDNLIVFLKNNPDVIPSRTLRRRLDPKNGWIGRSFIYFSATYYLDYDDEAKLSYMGLMFGEIVGRNYKLEKRV